MKSEMYELEPLMLKNSTHDIPLITGAIHPFLKLLLKI